jgi:serine/threonine protein kinase
MASNSGEELMQAWFSTTIHTERKLLTETDIRDITSVLERTSNVSWSQIPRIYSVLRIINQLQTIDCFLTEGISDVWFPFSPNSLPSSLRDQTARSDFLAYQQLVFNTRAQDLEREHTNHGHFRNSADVPLKKIGELGKGGYGFVDRVISTISHREYARKLIPRGRTFKKDKEVLRAFERELSSLKKSRKHKHVVELIGSYTEPKYVCIFTSPVADCNLHDFLTQQLDGGKRSFLRTYFGCLTSALYFLHNSQIRHKDIKPQNVLVKGEHVFLTDFGLALDWSEFNHSITTGPTWSTPRYSAPEVAQNAPRNSSADIWSLGCVFLEMWTVLKGDSKQSLENHLVTTGTCLPSYCSNPVGVSTWIESVRALPGSATDNAPAAWITNMMQQTQGARWTAYELEEAIHVYNEDPTSLFAFTGICCLNDDYTSESVHSSIDENVRDVTLQPSAPSMSEQHIDERPPVETCPKCMVPWSSCHCRHFEEGISNTQDHHDVRSIDSEERHVGFTQFTENPTGPMYPSQYPTYPPRHKPHNYNGPSPGVPPPVPPTPSLYSTNTTFHTRTTYNFTLSGPPGHSTQTAEGAHQIDPNIPTSVANSPANSLSPGTHPYQRQHAYSGPARMAPQHNQNLPMPPDAVFTNESTMAGLTGWTEAGNPDRVWEWRVHVQDDYDATQRANCPSDRSGSDSGAFLETNIDSERDLHGDLLWNIISNERLYEDDVSLVGLIRG